MYSPTLSQSKRCEKCKWWRPAAASSPTTMHCCHYILFSGHQRGPDPCDKFESRGKSKGTDSQKKKLHEDIITTAINKKSPRRKRHKYDFS